VTASVEDFIAAIDLREREEAQLASAVRGRVIEGSAVKELD
jgi:hypothetical protein